MNNQKMKWKEIVRNLRNSLEFPNEKVQDNCERKEARSMIYYR